MNLRLIRIHLLCAWACLTALPAWAAQVASPGAPGPGEDPYTVLEVKRYDWSEDLEVVRMSEGLWRIHRLVQEQRLWEEADRLARLQWREWYRDGSPESRARQWVLPRPLAPQFFTHGRFRDLFDAEDKLREVKREAEKRLERYRAYRDQASLFFLDNLLENRKVIRALIPKARQALSTRTDSLVKRWSENKKREIWTVVHQAEQKARALVAEKATESGELDALEVFNTQQDLLKPIYAQYKMTEEQWYLIWEQGDKEKWPQPKPEFLPATYPNVLQALQDLRSGKEGGLPQVILRNMGKAALGHLLQIAEDPQGNLRAEAFLGLALASGQSLGSDLAKWKGYHKELQETQARLAEAAKKAKDLEAEQRVKAIEAARLARLAEEAKRQAAAAGQPPPAPPMPPGTEAAAGKPRSATSPSQSPEEEE